MTLAPAIPTTVMTLALVMLAAGVGAPLRYLVDQAAQHRRDGSFPAGTFTINITGSLLLGLLTGLAAHHGLPALVLTVLGTGLPGAYTTFSTFSYETIRLLEDGAVGEAALNVAARLGVGMLAAGAGLGIALLLRATRTSRPVDSGPGRTRRSLHALASARCPWPRTDLSAPSFGLLPLLVFGEYRGGGGVEDDHPPTRTLDQEPIYSERRPAWPPPSSSAFRFR